MITVVSGLPRSGTSLLMRMLCDAGKKPLFDNVRKPDFNNPYGYYEWNPIKTLPRNARLFDRIDEVVVKIISVLLPSIPAKLTAQIIFVERNLQEVVRSQRAMLSDERKVAISDAIMIAALENHQRSVLEWLSGQDNLAVLKLSYNRLLRDPIGVCIELQTFLHLPHDSVVLMKECINPELYRIREVT